MRESSELDSIQQDILSVWALGVIKYQEVISVEYKY